MEIDRLSMLLIPYYSMLQSVARKAASVGGVPIAWPTISERK